MELPAALPESQALYFFSNECAKISRVRTHFLIECHIALDSGATGVRCLKAFMQSMTIRPEAADCQKLAWNEGHKSRCRTGTGGQRPKAEKDAKI